MASSKKYKCPYCEKRLEKEMLINHIENKHEDMIPENFTSRQVVFNYINKKTCGKCIVCGKETDWNDTSGKYNRLCNNPKCKQKLRDNFKKNMINAGKDLDQLKNPEFQKKMLAGRRISGKYKFKDGGVLDYVGTYEKKALEFFDIVLNVESKDIISPGPTIEYIFDGEKHFWITDFYYIPANLAIDVKDGGDNPNTRPMKSYRDKQDAKETAITKLGKYNYLRLTNNNFSQIMEVLADLKMDALDGNSKVKSYINEAVDNIKFNDSNRPNANIIVCNHKLSHDKKMFLSNGFISDKVIGVIEGVLKTIDSKEILKEYNIESNYVFKKNDNYYHLLEETNKDLIVSESYIYDKIANVDSILIDEIEYNPDFVKDKSLTNTINKLNLYREYGYDDDVMSLPLVNLDDIEYMNVLLGDNTELVIKNDINGYFLMNTENKLRLESVKNIREITKKDIDFLLGKE